METQISLDRTEWDLINETDTCDLVIANVLMLNINDRVI